MKQALIAGATGLTGMALLNQLNNDVDYSKIVVVGRRMPPLSSNKIAFIQSNFSNLDDVLANLTIDEVYCCLGTTIKKAGSQQAFRQVDFDAVIQLGTWAASQNTSRFAVISSVGANAKSTNFYLRTKGEMEEALKNLKLPSLVILRPSLLVGNREEFRWGEKISIWVMSVLNPLFFGKMKRYQSVHVQSVAKAMIVSGKAATFSIVESDEIKKYR